MLMYEYKRPSRVAYVKREDGGAESKEMHMFISFYIHMF